MPSPIKAAKLADQIRDYIALWLVIDFPNSFITVDQVTLSTNLLTATVWLKCGETASVRWGDINSKAQEYQKKLSTKIIRRSIPKIQFKIIN